METSSPPPLFEDDDSPGRPIFDFGLGWLCFCITAVITVAAWWLVPRFRDVSKDFGMKLPAVTIGVLKVCDFCVNRYWDRSGELHVNPLGLVVVWMAAAIPPFLVPLLVPGRRGIRVSRWIAAGVLVLLVAWLALGLLMPMVHLVQSVSAGGKKGH